MQPRLQRYNDFIKNKFLQSLRWNKDYYVEALFPRISSLSKAGKFQRVIFVGMGYSAALAQVVKGFFAHEQLSPYIEVINDYDLRYLIESEKLRHGGTLVIISSYSGNSRESIYAYERIKRLTQNIIFLTSGGEMRKIAGSEGISLISWRLRHPDSSYPLFHTPQCFSSLLDMLFAIGLLKSNYESQLSDAVAYLEREFTENRLKEAKEIAMRLKDKQLTLVASPRWQVPMLKLITMHFNEIAMAPAYCAPLHEFTHGGIAALTDQRVQHALIIFKDSEEDAYTLGKIQSIFEVFRELSSQNSCPDIIIFDIKGRNFFEKFFYTLLFFQHVVLSLGLIYNIESRALVSKVVKNPCYDK